MQIRKKKKKRGSKYRCGAEHPDMLVGKTDKHAKQGRQGNMQPTPTDQK